MIILQLLRNGEINMLYPTVDYKHWLNSTCYLCLRACMFKVLHLCLYRRMIKMDETLGLHISFTGLADILGLCDHTTKWCSDLFISTNRSFSQIFKSSLLKFKNCLFLSVTWTIFSHGLNVDLKHINSSNNLIQFLLYKLLAHDVSH